MQEAPTGLMTVEQYCELPEAGSFYYELHHGKLVRMSWANFGDALVRSRIGGQLDAALDGHGIVLTRLPFRALPEYELRVADVGYITRERSEQIKGEDYCLGAPDLIIEVLSPSTTSIEINEKIALCLANGCREFWIVDRRLCQITVSSPDGLTRTYRSGESIPLAFAENQRLMVDSVFVDEARDGIV
jgi:Uma2 family endonuclease